MKRAVITVVINKEGKILLLKRPPDHGKFPNQWCFPGGKIDYITEHIVTPLGGKIVERWETPEEAAIREAYEETGIRARVLTNSGIILADDDFIVYAYIAEVDDYKVSVTFPNKEHVEYQWFDPYTSDWEANEFPEGCGTMTSNALRKIALPYAVHIKDPN